MRFSVSFLYLFLILPTLQCVIYIKMHVFIETKKKKSIKIPSEFEWLENKKKKMCFKMLVDGI